ncbi:MAG: hypothetical protein JXB03_12615, partial [Spirochaetales bacterium]|nr:hypothetical protein [Spirochaetales bacterium]
MANLTAARNIMEYQENPQDLLLSPFKNLFEQDPLVNEPRFVAEGLFLYLLPEGISFSKDLDLEIYNIIRNIPSMEGLRYVNAINKEEEI